jgi:nicotinic acid phosphoribosyltransferase
MLQLTMVYAYWKAGKHNDYAVFDLFFRVCPFDGEYCIAAGLDEVYLLIIHVIIHSACVCASDSHATLLLESPYSTFHQVIKFVNSFRFSEEDIIFLK